MPEIMPPQLAGVQQRPFYVKARSVITVVSLVWLVLAVAGYGSFSGGTTSLALSLAMMYGTGVAILVVVSAAYRLLKRSAVRRVEHSPEDAAAAAFIDATRFAAEEIRAALTPARPGTRPAVSPWAADTAQVAAAVPVLREPGAEGAFARELLGRRHGAGGASAVAVPAVAAHADPAPAAAAPHLPAKAAGTPDAPAPEATTQAAKNTSAGKSVVNKRASSKKKKVSKPRPVQASSQGGKQASAQAGGKGSGKKTAAPAAKKAASSGKGPGSETAHQACSGPAAGQDMKRAA